MTNRIPEQRPRSNIEGIPAAAAPSSKKKTKTTAIATPIIATQVAPSDAVLLQQHEIVKQNLEQNRNIKAAKTSFLFLLHHEPVEKVADFVKAITSQDLHVNFFDQIQQQIYNQKDRTLYHRFQESLAKVHALSGQMNGIKQQEISDLEDSNDLDKLTQIFTCSEEVDKSFFARAINEKNPAKTKWKLFYKEWAPEQSTMMDAVRNNITGIDDPMRTVWRENIETEIQAKMVKEKLATMQGKNFIMKKWEDLADDVERMKFLMFRMLDPNEKSAMTILEADALLHPQAAPQK